MSDDERAMGPGQGDLPPDVRSTAIVPRSADEAKALARRISGDIPPNQGVFWCLTCGFRDGNVTKYPKGLTLDFDREELDALGGDPYGYNGPCPICNMMTLVGLHTIASDDFRTVHDRASANRKRDIIEATDVVLDKVQERVGGIFAGGLAGAAAAQSSGDRPPGQRDDLPDAGDVDLSGVKPR